MCKILLNCFLQEEKDRNKSTRLDLVVEEKRREENWMTVGKNPLKISIVIRGAIIVIPQSTFKMTLPSGQPHSNLLILRF